MKSNFSSLMNLFFREWNCFLFRVWKNISSLMKFFAKMKIFRGSKHFEDENYFRRWQIFRGSKIIFEDKNVSRTTGRSKFFKVSNMHIFEDEKIFQTSFENEKFFQKVSRMKGFSRMEAKTVFSRIHFFEDETLQFFKNENLLKIFSRIKVSRMKLSVFSRMRIF